MPLPFALLGGIAQAFGAAGKAMELINLGVTLGQAVADGIEGATEARDLVQQMVAEGRDPTEAEWAAINAVTDGYVDRIQAAADKAAAEDSDDSAGL